MFSSKVVKKMSFIFSFTLILMIAVACSDDSGAETISSGNGESVSLVAATINPKDTLLAQALQAFADEIEEQSDGEIEITVHTDGTLGNASSLYQSVISGDIDFIYSDPGWFAEHSPVFNVLSSNYLFRDQEHFESIVNSGDKLSYFEEKLVENPGLNTLMYIGGIERNILSTFPIESVEDLQGKEMRSGTGATEIEWWKALGANPTSIDLNEVYSALQTGVVEGSQNSLDSMLNNRFGEVAKYVARTQHNLTLGFVVMNNNRYESLSDEHKEAIANAAEVVQPEYIAKAFEQAERDMETLKEDFDVTFTEIDREGFIERSREQLDKLAEEYDVVDEVEDIFY
ncbi:TRAP transporter substrate-binding protein [Gracilibacillus sp. S3-1-1]|uniref:TRAP transporter substrate-binding protein n=1 Tax=Gracilibacillus pellucidus TaxID=3095368 RepID=A0ACC6M3S2_9BACI|nr:TRAP transporter substrate-binding protein [Gracilibacillus sp. S3-1-1]MDX8045515.1 TRAP transporter substrate-binding protein [Gracilibacillus sp. S3-1-1]